MHTFCVKLCGLVLMAGVALSTEISKNSQISSSPGSPLSVSKHVQANGQNDSHFLSGIKLSNTSDHILPDNFTHMISHIPAETLRLLRLVAVPVLNTTLYLPETILRQLSYMNTSQFSNSSHLPLLEHNLMFTYNSTIGYPFMSNHSLVNLTSWRPHMFNFTSIQSNLPLNTSRAGDFLLPVRQIFKNIQTSLSSGNHSLLDEDHLSRYMSNLATYVGLRGDILKHKSNDSTTAQPEKDNKKVWTALLRRRSQFVNIIVYLMASRRQISKTSFSPEQIRSSLTPYHVISPLQSSNCNKQLYANYHYFYKIFEHLVQIIYHQNLIISAKIRDQFDLSKQWCFNEFLPHLRSFPDFHHQLV